VSGSQVSSVRDPKASDTLTESSRVESSLTDSDAEGHNYCVSLNTARF
jgi:hypothetical protein